MYDKYKDGPVHHTWYEDPTSKEHKWYKKVIDYALDKVKYRNVLELGCGDGLFLKKCQENSIEGYGIDNSIEGIKLSKFLGARNVDYQNIEDYLAQKKDHVSYSTLVCINTIEHLGKPEAVVEIFKSVITHRAIIITDYPRERKGRYHVKEFQPEELLDLFKGTYKSCFTEEVADGFYALVLDK